MFRAQDIPSTAVSGCSPYSCATSAAQPREPYARMLPAIGAWMAGAVDAAS